ncbi:hypothetical protein JCM3765_000201 [Sporobolomyces pararoseus]
MHGSSNDTDHRPLPLTTERPLESDYLNEIGGSQPGHTTGNNDSTIERALAPLESLTVSPYLESLKRMDVAEHDQATDSKHREAAGAYIRVTGVPERCDEHPDAVFLVGAGDTFGNWELEDAFELASAREGTWETVAILELDRLYRCVVVAVYGDRFGVRAEVADGEPVHSFVVNEGRKRKKLASNRNHYDSWIVDFEWNT